MYCKERWSHYLNARLGEQFAFPGLDPLRPLRPLREAKMFLN
jgi:hypothetical protein